MKSELISERHLARRAVIYIRQSTAHQVLTNQESLRLQYDLRSRALELGWREQDVEVIDADLGQSGAGVAHREGFKDLIARVTLGQIGIVLSYEVTRLSRNCTDWYPLLDLCSFKNCLIGDRDGIYDPASANGRLLLGLKGQISEMELHTIRARLTAGLLNKAQRGELALTLPIGLVRDVSAVVLKIPDLEVQARLDLIFSTFLQIGSASKTLAHFNRNGLKLPRRGRFGQTCWRSPTIAAILEVLKNPAYAGAFVYGRSRATRAGPGQKSRQKKVPREQWRVIVKDKYPAYVNWQTFEKIQAMLRDNYAEYDRNKTRGVPRDGEALLHGIVYCGECGHKMVVQYKTGTRYICNYLRQQHGTPVCQNIPANPIDQQAVSAFFKAIAPAELNVLARTTRRRHQTDVATGRAQAQQVERLRYRAALAERQFEQCDPDNRLVASQLESRWEETLRDLRQAEAALAKRDEHRTPDADGITDDLRSAFLDLGQRLPTIWQESTLSTARKKAILRCLFDKVVVSRATRDVVRTRIVWRGGEATALDIPVTVGSMVDLSCGEEMERRIVKLARAGRSDEYIAEKLTAEGFRSPMRPRLIVSTVKGIRLRHGILQLARQSHPRHIDGYLTVAQIARAVGAARHWIYDRIHNGTIALTRDARTKLYLFPDKPATLAALRKLKAGKLKLLTFDKKVGS